MSEKAQKPIVIFRGDNTAAFDLRTIKILLTGDLDLSHATAKFTLLDFSKTWTEQEVATGDLSIVFTAEQTKAFALGPQVGTLRLYDMSTGTPRQLTIVNKIPFFVTNRVCEIDSQSYEADVCVSGGDVIHIEFKVGADAVEGKADKVKNATAGDLASLTEDGNLEDSGIPKTDVQRKLTFDATPTAGSQNPVTSDGIKQAIDAATPEDYAQVKAQVEQNTGDIADNTRDIAANATDISAINGKIPAQASAENQLADKSFVNSSIATNTANFLGTYDYVTDLGFQQPSSSADVSNAAIATALGSLTFPQTPTNNDYVFVQIDYTATTPADEFRRFKFNGTAWAYEYTLNNSSFTADQWAAINSGITSGDVAKLGALPTASELAASLLAKYEKPNTGIPKTDLAAGVQASLDKADSALQSAPVTSVNSKTGAVSLTASDVGALGNTGNQSLQNGILTATAFKVPNAQGGYIQLCAEVQSPYFIFSPDGQTEYRIDIPENGGTIAIVSQIYAAVQQIAPDFTAKAYALNELCTYNGVVYRCKLDYTATGYSGRPNVDATHWEAKKVSELFLLRTGGTMTGLLDVGMFAVKVNVFASIDTTPNKTFYCGDRIVTNGPPVPIGEQKVIYDRLIPNMSGTFALLQNLAPNFSTSATYDVGQLCVYNNKLYRCTTAVTIAEAWTAAHWTEATVQDVLAAIWTALGEIPSWAKATNKPSYTLNEVCPDVENWLGVPGTTAAGKSIKVLAKTVNGVIEGGVTVTVSSNNDNNTTKYRYGGVTVTRNGIATDYLFDDSQSGIARLSNVRYDMPTAVALVAEDDAATLVCADRAVTNATIAAGFSTLNLTFPTAVTGKVRDFYLRIVVAAGESAPALSIPQGITIENPDGAIPEIADGETSAASTTLVYFSETAPNVFTAKAETVKAVA